MHQPAATSAILLVRAHGVLDAELARRIADALLAATAEPRPDDDDVAALFAAAGIKVVPSYPAPLGRRPRSTRT